MSRTTGLAFNTSRQNQPFSTLETAAVTYEFVGTGVSGNPNLALPGVGWKRSTKEREKRNIVIKPDMLISYVQFVRNKIKYLVQQKREQNHSPPRSTSSRPKSRK
jgi:hypothetical protein